MEKNIRNAVRCFLIKDNDIVVIKYKKGTLKEGYYDIPGGKIEENETSEQTAIREMKEETSLEIKNLKSKGIMEIEYPNRKYKFEIFLTNEYIGEVKDSKENTTEWINMEELLKKPNILSNILLIDKKYIVGLIDEKKTFYMYIQVDENEKVLNLKYKLEDSF